MAGFEFALSLAESAEVEVRGMWAIVRGMWAIVSASMEWIVLKLVTILSLRIEHYNPTPIL